MIVGGLPFLLTVAVFLAASAHLAPFDQGIRLVLYLSGAEVLATVACLLVKRLRQVGAGLFTALFFTPVALLGLGFLLVLVSGSAF
jgi:hypothetical protein